MLTHYVSEAIYYRIHKLAYGADWVYDYEKFIEWDEKNRTNNETRGIPYSMDNKTKDKPQTHASASGNE